MRDRGLSFHLGRRWSRQPNTGVSCGAAVAHRVRSYKKSGATCLRVPAFRCDGRAAMPGGNATPVVGAHPVRDRCPSFRLGRRWSRRLSTAVRGDVAVAHWVRSYKVRGTERRLHHDAEDVARQPNQAEHRCAAVAHWVRSYKIRGSAERSTLWERTLCATAA